MTISYSSGVMRFVLPVAVLVGTRAAAQTTSAAAAMMQAARASGVPVGIVLRTGNDLCKASVDSSVSQTAEPLLRLRSLAHTYGYRVGTTGPVITVTPTSNAPRLLEKTLHHVWPNGPAFDAIMREMGMVLSGWMSVVAGAKGFGMDSGSGPDEPVFYLPSGRNETSQQIANRIVSLGSKGVWVAWQLPATSDHTRGWVSLVTLSYQTYDQSSIDTFRCQ